MLSPNPMKTEKNADSSEMSEETQQAIKEEPRNEDNAENHQETAVKTEETPVKTTSGISAATVQSQYVRLRGLPYNANEKDIEEFFIGLAIERVKFVSVAGRPNGEAFVEFKSREDAAHAMGNDRKQMATRYIEVFSAPESDGELAFRPEEPADEENYVVRLRGLPWSCKENDIRQFFDGLEPAPAEIVIGGTGGPRSRPSGEAFVRFASAEAAQRAMEYNKKHLGSRYVEVFQSSMIELNREKGFSGPAGPPSSYERTGIRPLMSLDRTESAYSGGSAGGNSGYGSGGYGGYEEPQRGYGQDYGYGGGAQGYDQGGYGSGDYASGGGNNGGGADPFRIYMRGLPYDADAQAVEAFFSPIRCHSVKLGINDTGRPSGDAIAEFDDYNDMVAGMARNNQRMGRRYVELFYTRDAPGPMRRLLWRETSGPNVQSAPAPDPVLSGRRAPAGGGGGHYRDAGGYRDGPQRESWSRPPRYDGPGGRLSARPPRADPWGGYGASSHDHQGYNNGGGWEGYGYGSQSQTAAGAYPAAAYDRQRESRDVSSSWGQQGAYGGWGGGSAGGGGY